MNSELDEGIGVILATKEDIQQINERLDRIWERQEASIHLQKLNAKNRMTQMLITLQEILYQKRHLTAAEIERYFGISRNWALNRMRSLSKIDPHVKFIKGRPEERVISYIVYLQKADLGNYEAIIQQIGIAGHVSLDWLSKRFDISLKDARLLAVSFCQDNPNYIVDENAMFNGKGVSFAQGVRILAKPKHEENVNC